MDLRERDFRPKLDKETLATTGLAALILVALTGFAVVMAAEMSSQQVEFPAYAEVNDSETWGIDADNSSERLGFGKVISGANSTKTVEISSQDAVNYVVLSSEGNISGNLHYQEEYFFVNSTDVPVMYAANETGYYEGLVSMDIKTAQNKWGEKWLELLYRLPF